MHEKMFLWVKRTLIVIGILSLFFLTIFSLVLAIGDFQSNYQNNSAELEVLKGSKKWALWMFLILLIIDIVLIFPSIIYLLEIKKNKK